MRPKTLYQVSPTYRSHHVTRVPEPHMARAWPPARLENRPAG